MSLAGSGKNSLPVPPEERGSIIGSAEADQISDDGALRLKALSTPRPTIPADVLARSARLPVRKRSRPARWTGWSQWFCGCESLGGLASSHGG